MATWTHPKLGKFKYDGPSWVAPIAAPPFDRFYYESIFSSGKRPKKGSACYTLSFYPAEEDEPPTAEQVAMAETVLAHLDALAPLVVATLWDEFNGRGKNSGMWWHGDLDEVANGLDDADMKPPKKAEDLYRMMTFGGIRVHKPGVRLDETLAELEFGAAFEEEHGVGILTDGKQILGTGYALDVTPYESD